MSTTFVFRLISNLTATKLVADEKALLRGIVPTTMQASRAHRSFYAINSM